VKLSIFDISLENPLQNKESILAHLTVKNTDIESQRLEIFSA